MAKKIAAKKVDLSKVGTDDLYEEFKSRYATLIVISQNPITKAISGCTKGGKWEMLGMMEDIKHGILSK